MEILPLLLILILFVIPPMLLMRTQRKRQTEVQQMRDAIKPGDHIVTVAGLHGTVAGKRDEVVDVEIAPGVIVQLELAGVLKVEPKLADATVAPTTPTTETPDA